MSDELSLDRWSNVSCNASVVRLWVNSRGKGGGSPAKFLSIVISGERLCACVGRDGKRWRSKGESVLTPGTRLTLRNNGTCPCSRISSQT